MALRRTRRVRGVSNLNDRVPPPHPTEDFELFCLRQPARVLDHRGFTFAWCRNGAPPPPNNPVKFRAIVDNPDGETDETFYPIGWAYKRLSFDPVSDRNRDRELRRHYDRSVSVGGEPDAYSIFPYMDAEEGLTLLISKSRIVDSTHAGYVSRTTTGNGVIFAPHNIFGMNDGVSVSSSYFYPDLSSQHSRLAFLLNAYKSEHGRFPDLYPDYAQACRDQGLNMRPNPSPQPSTPPPSPPSLPPRWR